MTTLFSLLTSLIDHDRNPVVYLDLDQQTILHENDAFKDVFKDVDIIEKKMILAINQQLDYLEFGYQGRFYFASFLKVKEDDLRGIIIKFNESNHSMLDRYMDNFFYTNNIPGLIIDDKSLIKAINTKFTETYNLLEKDLIGQSISTLISSKYLNDQQKDKLSRLSQGDVYINEFVYINGGNSQEIPVTLNVTPLFDYDRYIGGFVTVESLVERIKLSVIANSFQQVVESMSDAVILLDDQLRVIYSNQSYLDLTGYAKDDLIGRKIKVFDSSKHSESFENDVYQQVDLHDVWQGETWLKREDKRIVFVWLRLFKITDNDQHYKLYVASYRSLSHRDENSNMLIYYAQKDALTGLFNRYYFNDEVTQKLNRKKHQKHHLAFIDMDNFKTINDRFGHMFGDDVLVRFGNLINMIFSGHLIARYGGDEFVVYFDEKVSDNEVEDYQKEFEVKVDEFFKHIAPNLKVRASIGIAEYPTDGDNIQELINKADEKMYLYKRGSTR